MAITFQFRKIIYVLDTNRDSFKKLLYTTNSEFRKLFAIETDTLASKFRFDLLDSFLCQGIYSLKQKTPLNEEILTTYYSTIEPLNKDKFFLKLFIESRTHLNSDSPTLIKTLLISTTYAESKILFNLEGIFKNSYLKKMFKEHVEKLNESLSP